MKRIKPDAVITIADRFETISTAIAASYMNVPLVHIQWKVMEILMKK